MNRPARVVSFCQETREAVIRNYLDFTNLKEYASVAWEVTCDGAVSYTHLDVYKRQGGDAVCIGFYEASDRVRWQYAGN